MVVANDGNGLDACRDKEVYQDRLHLGLATLEVITSNVHVVAKCELDHTGHKGVLRATVDVCRSGLDRSDRKKGRGRDLLFVFLNCIEQVVRGIVDAFLDFAETLGVSGPQDNDLVQAVVLLEIVDVLLEGLEDGFLVALDDVVGAIGLVCSNKVRKVDGRHWHHVLHLVVKLILQLDIQHLGAAHGITKVHLGDIPSTDSEVLRLNHG
mmetsp:Transcript_22511/g.39898  ORF Transcript_22511/g.39898 Transcript_22511/m.39898 type:complete len:209 (+) Transcript_22511:687-1313(+)